MIRSRTLNLKSLTTFYVFVCLVGVHFVNLPLLADGHTFGKAFFWGINTCVIGYIYISKRQSLNLPHGSAPFGVLLLCFAVATFLSQHRFNSFLHLGLLLSVLFFWMIFTDLCREYKGFEYKFLVLVLTVGLFSSFLSLYQFYSFFYTGANHSELIPYLLPASRSIRVSGPYGQPNLFAVLLCISLLVYVYIYLHFPNAWMNKLRCGLKFIPFTIIAFVLFLTGSRSGIFPLYLSFCVLLWFYFKRNSKYEIKKMIILGLLLAVSFCLSKIAYSVFPQEDFPLQRAIVGRSSDERLLFWAGAVLIFKDFPLFGIGLDSFKFFFPRYMLDSYEVLGFVGYDALIPTFWAHNEILQIACEAGVFALLTVFAIILTFALQFVKNSACWREENGSFFYCYVFLIPFLFSAMLSRPFRYLPLLTLFFAFLGLLCSRLPAKKMMIGRQWVFSLKTLFVLAGLFLLYLAFQEAKVGLFKDNLLEKKEVESTLAEFDELYKNPYSNFAVDYHALPIYVDSAQRAGNIILAKRLLPYAEESVLKRGTFSQWYNLALLYGLTGENEEAKAAIKKAIDLKPNFQPSWHYQHYLHMLDASRSTGRPLEDFMPQVDELKGLELLQGNLDERSSASKSK